jgi:hypothetical protein
MKFLGGHLDQTSLFIASKCAEGLMSSGPRPKGSWWDNSQGCRVIDLTIKFISKIV